MDSTPEINDFFDRHLDGIADALQPKPIVHTCPHPPGKRMWRFSWRWPFIHTWISNAICCCEINQTLKKRCNCASHCICDIVDILDRLDQPPEVRVYNVYLGDMEPEDQRTTVENWHKVLEAAALAEQ